MSNELQIQKAMNTITECVSGLIREITDLRKLNESLQGEIETLRAEQPGTPPNRANMEYSYKKHCTAASMDSPDCICWVPKKPMLNPATCKIDGVTYMAVETKPPETCPGCVGYKNYELCGKIIDRAGCIPSKREDYMYTKWIEYHG